MNRLKLNDVQGNILEDYEARLGCHVSLRIDHAAPARRWLGQVANRVTTAATQAAAEHDVTCNIAFSAAGLAALGVRADVVAGFSLAYREGMTARARHLGDAGPSGPKRWEQGLADGQGHVLVSLHAQQNDKLGKERRRLRKQARSAGMTVVYEQKVHQLPGGREHFGFRDPISQPVIAGAGPDGDAAPSSNGGPVPGRPLPVGEFLLGHPDLEGVIAPRPSGALGYNGTYLVFRKLAQDVAGFRQWIRAQAEAHGLSEGLIEAKIVGRWRDGTPVSVSPDRPMGDRGGGVDDFGYADDPDGFACPVGAHIRRCNPRDGLEFGWAASERHRIIRRGMPYGPPLRDGGTDGRDRGLVFICLVGDIERQFEFIQTQWCNDGNAFGLGGDRDFLVGRGPAPAKMTIPGRPPRFLAPLPQFVTTRGGGYFFIPGVTGLRTIADGVAGVL